MTTAQRIEDFLKQKRLALIGLSRDKRGFSRSVFRALTEHGYEVIPVNPRAREIDGITVSSHVRDIQPPARAALIFTGAREIDQAVRDCAEAGVMHVWLPLGTGHRLLTSETAAFCRSRGVTVIAGFCPFMFLPRAGFGHRLHAFFAKRSRRYRT
jgi:predicted CoA-binding protein